SLLHSYETMLAPPSASRDTLPSTASGIRHLQRPRGRARVSGVLGEGLRALAQLAAFALRQPAPYAESLVVLERVFEALCPNLAGGADLLGVARGATFLGKEGFRVGLRAERVALPGERVIVVLDGATDSRNPPANRIDEPVVGNASGSGPQLQFGARSGDPHLAAHDPVGSGLLDVERHSTVSPPRNVRLAQRVRDNYTGVVTPASSRKS